MELLLPILVVLYASPVMASPSSYDFDWMQASLFRAHGLPSVQGSPERDTFLEIEGFHLHRLFDSYWFVDIQDIDNSPANDTHGSDATFYAEGRIRLSLDALLDRDLAVGPLRQWLIAYELDLNDDDYGGGLLRHHIGIGTDLQLEGADYFQINLMARYVDENYDSPNENTWDGYLFNVNYGGTLADLGQGARLYFSGWLDWNFAADHSRSRTDFTGQRVGSSWSVQWFNQFRLMFGDFNLAYGYKFNRNFAETQSLPGNSTNSGAHVLGFSYQHTF